MADIDLDDKGSDEEMDYKKDEYEDDSDSDMEDDYRLHEISDRNVSEGFNS